MALDCVETVVGLSQKDCSCLGVDGQPVNYNTSLSGLFIDDIGEGIPLIIPNSTQDCGEQSIWSLLVKARDEALNDFYSQFLIMLTNPDFGQVRKQKDYDFQVGDLKKVSTTLSLTKTLAGVIFTSKNKDRGSVLRVNELCLYVNDAVAKTISIYKREDDQLTLVHTEAITPTANRLTCIPIDDSGTAYIDLPLVDRYGVSIEYFFLYDRGTSQPFDVKYSCGCGGHAPVWMKEFNFAAIETDTFAAATDAGRNASYTYGLILKAELYCDATKFICDNLDFVKDSWGRIMAKTIQLMSIRNLIKYVSFSTAVNRFTLLNKDTLIKRRAELTEEINYRMEYLAAEYPFTKSDCYICRGAGKFKKQHIVV